MSHDKVRGLVALGAVLFAAHVAWADDEADKARAKAPGKSTAAGEVVAPAAPVLRPEIVAGMQEGRYKEVIAALDRLAKDEKAGADDRAYYGLIRAIAQRLSGKPDDARATASAAFKAAPKGRWAAKLRAEQAASALAAGKFAEADSLARDEAEALLAGDRKDRLARVYEEFARLLLRPDNPVAPADPEGAHALLIQARELAKGPAPRGALLRQMAQASQAANNHPRAIEEFQLYLKDYPKAADRSEVRFQLGASQLAAGQALPARLTWTDLARDLEKVDAKDAADIRGQSLHGIARTYGIPAPPDDRSLNLGVAALRRLLSAYPGHPQAVRAAYEIGAANLVRGKSQQAIEAFQAFLKGDDYKAESDDARREHAQLAMTATFQVGQILQGQEKFAEAIAAFRGYLAKYPDGPQSADAQRAILDTQLLAANDLLRREKYADARKALLAFTVQNPLDPRVPQLLYQVGESFLAEKKYDEAISAWETLAGKFPGTEPAAHAQFQIAALHEGEKGDPAGAIERFKKVQVEPWLSQARQRIAVMEAKALTVVTPRAFRSGETPHLKIASRNLEKLTFAAYKLDAEAYFRKKHSTGNVESLDVSLVAPDAEWTAEVPDYAKYKPIDVKYDLDALKPPGVWVVKVTDEKTLQATSLVLGSDLDVIVKSSREQALVFAQDMKTGKGRAGARVLISDGGQVVMEATTGKDGVLLKAWDKPRGANTGLTYLVLDGPDVAGSGLGIPGAVSQGLTARAYLYTDRPAYRPGQDVSLRGIVREVADGQYANPARATYRLEVTDSRGRRLVARDVKLSAFGAFADTVPIDSGAPVGTYRVRLFQPGKSDFAGQFEVQSYQLQKVDLAIDLPQPVYFRGQTVKGEAVARYQYGTPMAGRPITVHLPDGRALSGTTDATGKYKFQFDTDGFAEEQVLTIVAQLPQDNVQAAANVALAVNAFRIELKTNRDVYLDGESFRLEAKTVDAKGDPTGQSLSVAVLKRVEQGGRITEREVSKEALKTDPKTGEGVASLRVDDEQGGSYVVRVAGTDRFGNPIVVDRALSISGSKDETKLRLLAERQGFKSGETAKVNLHSRGKAGPALLAWEADRILRYRIVALKVGDNPIEWDVDGAQFPNFTLTAARMAGDRFDQASLDIRVERDLRVTVAPRKETVGPGEEVEVVVTTKDQLGNPVAAEVSLALVDRALLRLHGDNLPPIGAFFYNQTRTGAFATTATNTFRYQPATTPVAEAVVEEAQRQLAAQMNDADAKGVREEAKAEVLARVADAAARPSATPFADTPVDALPSLTNGHMMQAPAAMESLPMAGSGATAKNKMGGAGGGMMGGLNFGRKLTELDKKAGKDSKRSDEFRSRRSYMALSARADGEKLLADDAEPSRDQYVETAYWNPAVVTGEDGTARVKFRAPYALSEYRFSARGVTGADTLAGQATADLAVRKDFFVELKTPSFLTQGDKPRVVARLHHVGVKGEARIRLSLYAGGREVIQPRKVDMAADGVEEILFDPFEIPEADNLRLVATAEAGDAHGLKDSLTAEVPIRPWGVQAVASASGSASDDSTAFVALPEGRKYEGTEMLLVVSPTTRRLLIELALGQDAYPMDRHKALLLPTPTDTTADRAADLLAASSALSYLRAVGGVGAAPEASRLESRVSGLAAELVAGQNDDGGWPWVGGALAPGQAPRPSDPAASARAAWALASAEPLGLLPDPTAADKAATYLTAALARADAADHATRAAILHALSTRGKATFEQANAMNRLRQNLGDAALAHLALTFANLDRASLAGEVLDVLGPRARPEASGPGKPARQSWGDRAQAPTYLPTETTALVALAYARVRPGDPKLSAAVDWLLAHRQGTGWQPHPAKGAALAALGAFYSSAKGADDRYRLTITVNDVEVYKQEVVGAAEGKAILVPRKAVKADGRNAVRFDIEGRGSYGYSITLSGFTRDFGPDQDRANRPFILHRRDYLAAAPELEGRPLPTGFGSALNAPYFENKATQVALGGTATVRIDAYRQPPAGQPAWDRDFLILEEFLPAGATLIEGSVRSQAGRHTLEDGVLTFYFAPDQYPGNIQYEVNGYLPGQYRALPPILRSAYDPGRRHLGPAGDLRVLAADEKPTDPYKPTPDELYARGKGLFDLGRLADAAGPLEALFGGYALRDDVAKDAARMLLAVHIARYDPKKIVIYFEVLKEKAPELVVSFDQIRVVGRAYGDLGEHERAYLVWRAVSEASYLEDARVGEVLRQRGRTLEGVAYLLGLWREYPNSASIEGDFFGLSQLLSSLAGRAQVEPALRRELLLAEVTRPQLLLQAIRLTQVFLSQSPTNPLADEASLALVGAYLDLEDFESVVKLSAKFAGLYPKSPYLDSFQYGEALGMFHLGRYDRAIEVAAAIARATYKDAAGAEKPSPNKWQALYILGQIHDARREPGEALKYYEQVADRFGDAAGAVKALKRRELKLPEVTVIRPAQALAKDGAGPAGGVGLRAIAPAADPEKEREKGTKPAVTLDYRNVAEADVKVYPVDLMRLYLTRRSLAGIAGIDLAGIRPLLERTVKLGDGADYDEKVRSIDLPLTKEGAYLVMARGKDLYASGIVLVSPLEMEVLEEAESGRVRVTVRDARTKAFASKVQVKVIGTENPAFLSGETDLRGVFTAEGVVGQVTAVAREGTGRYAFHRGTQRVGAPPAAQKPNDPAKADPGNKPGQAPSLDQNIQMQNSVNRSKQLERLNSRYAAPAPAAPQGVQVDSVK